MRRGTTTSLVFTLPEEISIAVLYITFQQKGKTVLEKTLDDVSLDGKEITLPLSQEDTLALADDAALYIQLRIRDTAGNALASQVIRADVREILKDGVI